MRRSGEIKMIKPADKKLRVLVVDDSTFMCKVLKEIINADPQLEVVGQGRDGRDAVALAESLRPDVITMDINMPHVNGLEATELIMSQNPRPIVIVSSESREGASSTLRALELGAIDFVPKPSSGIDLDMKDGPRRTHAKTKDGGEGPRDSHSHSLEASNAARSGSSFFELRCGISNRRAKWRQSSQWS